LAQVELEVSAAKEENSALVDKVVELTLESQRLAHRAESLAEERDVLHEQLVDLEHHSAQQAEDGQQAERARRAAESRKQVALAWEDVARACQAELMLADRELELRKHAVASFEGVVGMADAMV
jgi:chromosome segregation ATPase